MGTAFPKKTQTPSQKSLPLIFHEVLHGTWDGAGMCTWNVQESPSMEKGGGNGTGRDPTKTPHLQEGLNCQESLWIQGTIMWSSHFILGEMSEGPHDASAVTGLGVMPESLKKINQ